MIPSTDLAAGIRHHALRMVSAANASHIGGVLSMADTLAVLYSGILKVFPDQPSHQDRDRFILSKGHCCAGVYAALALRGFFPLSELDSYGMDGSRLMTHISHKVPGVEFSTGSLGHGLPVGAGHALAAQIQKHDYQVLVCVSDGECNEGTVWEAAMFAAARQLQNLTVVVDYNKWQATGRSNEVMQLSPLREKWAAFGWKAVEIDGHDIAALVDALDRSKQEPGKPTAIIANTVKGKGVSFMEDDNNWHYRVPKAAEVEAAKKELGLL